MLCRADAVTDLDEGAAPSDPTQGPAEGQSEAAPDGQSGAAPEGKEAEDPSAFLQQEGEAADVYARRIFERVYGHDIERVLRMEVRLHASAAFKFLFVDTLGCQVPRYGSQGGGRSSSGDGHLEMLVYMTLFLPPSNHFQAMGEQHDNKTLC